MIWFFERESSSLRCEIRREMAGDGYEVVVAEGAAEKVERVDSPSVLLERSQHVWAALLADGWRPLGNDPRPLR